MLFLHSYPIKNFNHHFILITLFLQQKYHHLTKLFYNFLQLNLIHFYFPYFNFILSNLNSNLNQNCYFFYLHYIFLYFLLFKYNYFLKNQISKY
jgi:hypothetical protein